MDFDELGEIAEVGDDGHFYAVGAESEADGIGGIVGDGEGVNVDIADGEMSASINGFDATQTFFEAIGERALKCVEGLFGDIERRFIHAQHLGETVAVIGMFVSDEDAVNLIERDAAGGKAGKGFAFAEAAIHQETGTRGFEQSDVARTAGSQDGDA